MKTREFTIRRSTDGYEDRLWVALGRPGLRRRRLRECWPLADVGWCVVVAVVLLAYTYALILACQCL